MNLSSTSDVYYDPYNVEIYADPYPVFRRLREEAPLYYNEQHDFYAVSRFDDVERGAARPGDVHLRARRHPRADQGEHRDPAGRAHLRGPARAHRAPWPVVTGVHAEEGRGARAQDPRVLRPQPRPARRSGAVRLRRGPRRPDADADDRHAARHPGAGPGVDPRLGRREPSHGGREAHAAFDRTSAARCSPSTSTGAPSTPRTT